jgi:hypothetical protein
MYTFQHKLHLHEATGLKMLDRKKRVNTEGKMLAKVGEGKAEKKV